MDRKTLPDRRPNTTVKLKHKGHTFHVTIGVDHRTGQVAEVFGTTAKAGSDFDALLQDACILISLALQTGWKPEDVAKSLSRAPVLGDTDKIEGPASAIGVIMEAVIDLQKELN